MARTSIEHTVPARGFRRSNGGTPNSRQRKNSSGFFSFLRGKHQSPRRPLDSPRANLPHSRSNITPNTAADMMDESQRDSLKEDRRTSIVTVLMRRRSSTVSTKSGMVEDLLDMKAESKKTKHTDSTAEDDPAGDKDTAEADRSADANHSADTNAHPGLMQSCPASPGTSTTSFRNDDDYQPRIPSNASTNASRGAFSALVRRMSSQFIPAANLPSGHPAFDDHQPMFEYERFGKRWAADVFVLFNNAARREMRDLQRAISAMKLKLNNGCLQLQDFADFFVWFAHVRAFLFETFAVHETIIFPWLESVIPMEGALTKQSRTGTQATVSKYIRNIEKLRKLDHEKIAVDSIMSISDFAEPLFEELTSYFGTLEERCPPLIEMFFSEESTKEVEAEIRNKLMKGKDAQVVFPILVNWMEPEDMNEWVVTNMKGGRKLMMFYWQKNFERTHGGVLDRVCKTDSV